MSFGSKLKQLRESKGLTQKELGEQLNYTYQNISKWEKDLSVPKLDTLIEISKFFSVSIDSLVFEKNIETDIEIDIDNDSVELKDVDITYVDKPTINKLINNIIITIVVTYFIYALCNDYIISIVSILISLVAGFIFANLLFKISLNSKINMLFKKCRDISYIIPNFIDKIGSVFVIFKIPSLILTIIIYFLSLIVLSIYSLFIWKEEEVIYNNLDDKYNYLTKENTKLVNEHIRLNSHNKHQGSKIFIIIVSVLYCVFTSLLYLLVFFDPSSSITKLSALSLILMNFYTIAFIYKLFYTIISDGVVAVEKKILFVSVKQQQLSNILNK